MIALFARSLAQGSMDSAQQEAQAVFTANAGLWMFHAQPVLGSVTSPDGVMVSCTVTSSSVPVVSILGVAPITASVTATD